MNPHLDKERAMENLSKETVIIVHGTWAAPISLQKIKRRSGQFSAKERNKRQAPLNRASNAPKELSVSLARSDVVPHIVVPSPRLRLGEFEGNVAKRLLQHYRAESCFLARLWQDRSGRSRSLAVPNAAITTSCHHNCLLSLICARKHMPPA
jgi:hypothetical protein